MVRWGCFGRRPDGQSAAGGFFDHNADSYGRYGAQTGIRRLARLLGEAGVQANIFTSGMHATRDPEQVKALVRDGHELVAHGFAQDLIPSRLSAEDDEASIARTTADFAELLGAAPSGWISPRATAGEETMRRLVKHGYRWQGDSLDADLPYLQRFPEGDLIAIPLSIEFNDLSHSMRFGRTPQQFIDMFEQTLPHLLAARDDCVIVDVLVHAHCYGRPACAWAYGEIAKRCASRDDIWVTTRGRIADHFATAIAQPA